MLQVIHTPGHTLGHISLYAPDEQILILGDAVHGDDVAWINPFREGAAALQRTLETLDRQVDLPVSLAYSGHGVAIEDLGGAIGAARQRYAKWLGEPQKAHWHSCKRIFAYALMIKGGFTEKEVTPYLLRCPWFEDYARHSFDAEPEDFVEPLLEELLRSKAAGWQDGKLVVLAPHSSPPAGWPSGPTRPKGWPRLLTADS